MKFKICAFFPDFFVILKENGDTLYITRYEIQDMCIFPDFFVILKENGDTLYIIRYEIQDICIFPNDLL